MIVIRWAAGLLALLCFVLVVVRMRADSVLLLGTIFLGIFVWSMGWLHREAWIDDEPAEAPASVLDARDGVHR